VLLWLEQQEEEKKMNICLEYYIFLYKKAFTMSINLDICVSIAFFYSFFFFLFMTRQANKKRKKGAEVVVGSIKNLFLFILLRISFYIFLSPLFYYI